MKRGILYLVIAIICFSCKQTPEKTHEKPITDGIAIFEVYLEDSVAVDNFSNFLRDTLKLPVEWEPFDIFGNKVVYDAAFYLGVHHRGISSESRRHCCRAEQTQE